jgi:hypothetical protein
MSRLNFSDKYDSQLPLEYTYFREKNLIIAHDSCININTHKCYKKKATENWGPTVVLHEIQHAVELVSS